MNSKFCPTVGSSGLLTHPGQLKPCASGRRTEYCGFESDRENSKLFCFGVTVGWETSLRLVNEPRGKYYFTQIDVESGHTHVTIAEKDQHRTAYRDANGSLYEFIREGLGLAILPAAFTRIVKRALRNPHPDIINWLNAIFISSSTCKKYMTTLAEVLTKMSNARLSDNYGTCRFTAPS